MLIGYARVSTFDQNPALQIDALERAGCARLAVEQASGARRDRPVLDALLVDLRPGDTLVVWKLDRLARSLAQLIGIVQALAERDIGFRCLTSAINTDSAEGRLFFHMTAAFAEFERDIIRERTRAGLEAAKRRGQTLGRPRKISDAGVLILQETMAKPGARLKDIQRRLGVSKATIYRQMQRERRNTLPPNGGVLQPHCKSDVGIDCNKSE